MRFANPCLRLLRTSACALMGLVAVVPARGGDLLQDFEAWPVGSAWGESSQAGWTLAGGQVRFNRGGFGIPLDARCGWLADADTATNLWLQSPRVSPRLGALNFFARNSDSATGTNLFMVETSADGTNWQPRSTFAHDAGVWTAYSVMLNMSHSGFVRLRKTGDTGVNLYLGLDNVRVTDTQPEWASSRELTPSSRQTALIFSEIMYHPADRADGRSLEFVELFNTESVAQDIGGFRLAGDIGFTFPSNTVFPPRQVLVVARDPVAMQAVLGVTALGPYTNALPNGGGTVRLRNRQGAILLETAYGTDDPWPVSADGAGPSLVLWRPDFGEDDARAWGASGQVGGSPGGRDALSEDALSRVRINEFLAHTDLPQTDFIEIFNAARTSADLSGCTLSDGLANPTFAIPAGTVLPPGGFRAFSQAELSFSLSQHGDDIYLRTPDGDRVLDAVRFPAQANGVSSGRAPDGMPELRILAAPTPGAANAAPRQSDVVINEIMFHPISESDSDTYVELLNCGTSVVDVGQWRFVAGIDFTLPAGTRLAAGGYLVVAADATNLIAHYPQLHAGNTVGNFRGRLSRRGERLTLAKPDDPALPFEDFTIVDEVTYAEGWGRWSDGGGSSLERIDAHGDSRRAMNWADSDETDKASWTLVEQTGTLDLGLSQGPNELHALLLDAGECQLDGIEVRKAGGPNLVPNGDFESGLDGWLIQGNHRDSMLDRTGAHTGLQSLSLIADGDGDTGSNRAEIDLSGGLSVGDSNVTIRAYARWRVGHRRVLLRLLGNWLECSGLMVVPDNLGSPGQRNSRWRANAGPALWDLAHAPLLPAANSNVTVRVQAQDPDGVRDLTLQYRIDPAVAYTAVPMHDDGSAGDERAGDGVFAGTIPGQPGDAIVAFRVEAVDNGGDTNALPTGTTGREALVSFGQTLPGGTYGVYRFWISAATRSAWAAEPKYSNREMDATLVYNDWRVIYNAGIRYRGSPFMRPSGDPLAVSWAYAFKTPSAEPLLGVSAFDLDGLEFGRDATCQRERLTFWMADRLGAPFNPARYVHVYLNNQRKGIVYSDGCKPNRNYIEHWFADDADGALREVNDAFEFNDTLAFDYANARMEDYTTTGGEKKQARYRWNWRLRPRDAADDDHRDLFGLVDALNLPLGEVYGRRVGALADVQEWMRLFAVRHFVADWDSYAYNRGKNFFVYRPLRGPWRFLMWDSDASLGASAQSTTTDGLLSIEDPVMASKFFVYPPFRRAYWQALQSIVDGPALPAESDPVLDAQFAAFLTNGVSAAAPDAVKTWIAARRAFVEAQLAGLNPPFTIATPDGITTNSRIALAGTAPLAVHEIWCEGRPLALRWNSETVWQTDVPLQPGTNVLNLTAVDEVGVVVGEAAAVWVCRAEQPPSPAGQVVINEIMYASPESGGNYVEFYNRAPAQTFDLTGWRLSGVDFAFPSGSLIAPGGFLVVAESAAAYARLYTNAEALAGAYAGTLDRGGETLRLLMPADGTNWIVIDEVTYDDDPPWPAAAGGGGQALQLLDADQDNDRAGNWMLREISHQHIWQFRSVTGVVSNAHPSILSQSKLRLFLSGAAKVHVDGLTLVTGAVAGVGANLVANGGFESGLSPWLALGSHVASAVATNAAQSGAVSLGLAATGPGDTSNTVQQTVSLEGLTGQPLTLGAWYLESTNLVTLRVELANSTLAFGQTAFVPGAVFEPYTPGRPNALATNLPALARVWINEIMPSNTTILADNAGDYDPWIELYNAETSAVDLADFRMSNDYGAIGAWAFPTGTVIGAGQRLLIWADGQPGQNGGGQIHAGFRLSVGGGCVTLARISGARLVLIDDLDYGPLAANVSYGGYPEGRHDARQVFLHPSPGSANNPASVPVAIAINEWMARNTQACRDPSDGRFEDWFELYNRGDAPAALAGYHLTDDLLNPLKFMIPLGTVVPAQGFLVVWADGDTTVNAPGSDLHTSFSLNQNGESIGLSAPDGQWIDALDFGPMAADASAGRWPDGGPVYDGLYPYTPGDSNRLLTIRTTSTVAPGGFQLDWDAVSAGVYRVDASATLLPTNWVPVGVTTARGTSASLTDTNAAHQGQRFYRLWLEEN